MERGDLGGVSESVLLALVRALELDEAETMHLFDLARVATQPRRAPRVKREPRVSARIAQLLDTMRDVPAIALNRLGDPLASNALGRALFPDLFPEGTTPLNHTRYLFVDVRSQTSYPDWESSARASVSALQSGTEQKALNQMAWHAVWPAWPTSVKKRERVVARSPCIPYDPCMTCGLERLVEPPRG